MQKCIGLYWSIGEYVSKQIDVNGWGKSTVKALSEYILSKEPGIRGYSSQNIWRMKQFYETYKDKPELSKLLRENTWSNNLHIISKTRSYEEKEFYLKLASKEKYKAKELARQIDSGYYERLLLSNGKAPSAIESKDISPGKCVLEARKRGIPTEHMTMSSDGHGSWSNYAEDGTLLEIGVSGVDALYKELNYMVKELGMPLEEVDDDTKCKILGMLDKEASEDVQLLLSYDEDEIGSYMTTNFILIHNDLTVREAMRELVKQAGENDNISTIYVVDRAEQYYGAIELQDLIIAREHTELEDLISRSYPYVMDHEKISECIEKIKDYAEEDLNETTRESIRKRLPWLVILTVMALLFLGAYIHLFKGFSLGYSMMISACVGVSLVGAMVVSSLVGTLTPIFFKKVGVDPTVASGPLITTINDLVTIVVYYGLVAVVLIDIIHLV